MSLDVPDRNFTQVQYLEVGNDHEGQRLDNYLIRLLKGLPRSRVYRLLRKGEIRVNARRAKPDTRLHAGDQLRLPPVRLGQTTESRSKYIEENILKTIIYENKLMLIINKPSGMAVHGGSGISAGVIESLRRVRPHDSNLELIHRLDRGTSGCLMIARKRSWLKRVQAELHRKEHLKKSYLAVVHGRWPKHLQEINAPIRRSVLQSGERVCRVDKAGKASLTRYRLVACGAGLSVLEVMPVTGRTHQIRVHCRYAGCPVVGDDKYGFEDRDGVLRARGFQRLMLHASRLDIPSLDDQPAIKVEAPRDEQMNRIIERIKNSNKQQIKSI